ncbi:hypothetical protein FAMCQIZV_CDS0014 [Phage C72C1]|nr:hypothetical protein FAMCQIZV_CDS0014 [Phage C72C1]
MKSGQQTCVGQNLTELGLCHRLTSRCHGAVPETLTPSGHFFFNQVR